MTVVLAGPETTIAGLDPRVVAQFNARAPFALTADNIAILCEVGSRSHNTWLPKTDPLSVDDIDLMLIVVPPPEIVLGLSSWDGLAFFVDEYDVVAYSLDKFVHLLAKGNPNVLGTLWLKPEHYLHRSLVGDILIAMRDVFSSKQAYHAFAGYANGQLQRMTAYSPEIDAEIERLTAELEAAGWHLQDVMDKRSVPMPIGLTPDEANAKADRLRTLRARYHSAYMGEKRRSLVRQYGHDTKNAAHLIRLLAMCCEFLRTGQLNVFRTHDAEMLKAIKRGEWTLEQVKDRATELFEAARVARDDSLLPDAVDAKAVSALLVQAYSDAWGVEL